MCLVIKKGCNIEVADEDIICWKVIATSTLKGHEDKWLAPIRETEHVFEKTLIACDSLTRLHFEPTDTMPGEDEKDYIEEGFHAFIDMVVADLHAYYSPCVRTVVQCTIPKGAQYCLGDSLDIVANKIIVHKNIVDVLY